MHVTQIYMPTGGFDKQSVYCINKRKSVVLHPAVFYSHFQCISNASTTLQLMIGSVFPCNCFIPAVFAWAPALTLKHTCSYSRVRVAWLESRPTSTSAHTSWNLGEFRKANHGNQNNLSMKSDSGNVCEMSNSREKFCYCLNTKDIFILCRLTRAGCSNLAFPPVVNLESPLMANMCIGRTRLEWLV